MDRALEEFILLLTRAQPTIYACIFSLLPDRSAAQDLLQETNLAIMWWSRSRSTREIKLHLNNSSFEELTTVFHQPTMAGWYGDAARVVAGAMSITPLDGDHMLQLVRSTSDPQESCEVYQVIDLRDLPRSSAGYSVYVEATVAVNKLSQMRKMRTFSR